MPDVEWHQVAPTMAYLRNVKARMRQVALLLAAYELLTEKTVTKISVSLNAQMTDLQEGSQLLECLNIFRDEPNLVVDSVVASMRRLLCNTSDFETKCSVNIDYKGMSEVYDEVLFQMSFIIFDAFIKDWSTFVKTIVVTWTEKTE